MIHLTVDGDGKESEIAEHETDPQGRVACRCEDERRIAREFVEDVSKIDVLKLCWDEGVKLDKCIDCAVL